ncbi:TMEM165/GDT1 family protein [Clostridium beijerinckii]|uniref:TMEM165/GDT1 family protein n=1 Tax=Clostridium beijerinckii TaxID=1520 RepID=UPI00098CB566|nr:TMEM165/GDT1 family protein [Clostridium beijerinckii]MBA8934461.1 putative Ca2+/H+ antiporter (TMEM165/GDT1 family) [Clostridium beijerinckii]NRT35651.1 putative Ca2+/H+ antiporter (TMEM165/GDT1 family) [Clostridium beijerinckii]NRT44921.1 putative Ca2+/H+ antiporter (TMEM165/GDT1 family) [Clostridium beijerinckii]NRU38648.1 putative Ca2+/H+ antiporter (TMEM165/GDT1 family) [Clostridium beijerinckii]NRZ21084.1 putative Ca2+/H+ antiporter (TMEM165/GDT1 family) [Clostridium beijerinckii]
MASFIKALLLVVVAEMGDKTQLLAMAMVSKYKAKQVLLGVLIATILNHALAVAVGSYLSSVIPMDLVKIIAALSFLAFGLWTIRGDKLDDEENKKVKFGPIVTVAIAFFLAEMGDKTQLITITIAAENQQPLFILMGTTVGMLIADGIGILGGAWMCKHIPDIYIKWVAGAIFMFFGTLTLYNSVPAAFLWPLYIVLYLALMGLLIYIFGVKFAYFGQACDIASAKKDDLLDIESEEEIKKRA